MRRLLAVFLLISLFCQSFAMAAQSFAPAHTERIQQEALELKHSVMHWDGIPHHHDEHGAVHQDSSDASFQHILGDGSPHNAMPWQLPALPVVTLGSLSLPGLIEQPPPQPHLDGLRRPPRAHS